MPLYNQMSVAIGNLTVDDNFTSAHSTFLKKFPVAEQASHAYSELRAEFQLCMDEMVSTLGDAASALADPKVIKRAQSLHHQLDQLCCWSTTPTDDALSLAAASHLTHCICQANSIKRLDTSVEGVDVMHLAETSQHKLKPIMHALAELMKLGQDQAMAKFKWMLGETAGHARCEYVWAWMSSQDAVLRGFTTALIAAVQEDLQAPIMKLKSSVDVFKPSSTNKVAEKVKKVHAALEEKIDEVLPLFSTLGLELKLLDEGKELLDKSTAATVHWGVHTLLGHKDIERIAEGEKGRQSLKAIMEAYPTVVEESLPAELVKQAKKVMKVDEPDVPGEGHEGEGTTDGGDASGTCEGVVGTQTKAKRLRVGT